MPITIDAEIDVGGNVRLLGTVEIKKKSRATVTILDEVNGENEGKGNAHKVLEFLRNNRLPEESRHTPEEIEAWIEENRNSWD